MGKVMTGDRLRVLDLKLHRDGGLSAAECRQLIDAMLEYQFTLRNILAEHKQPAPALRRIVEDLRRHCEPGE